jgi:hypothetical protein
MVSCSRGDVWVLAAASNVGQLAGPAVGGVLYAAVGAGPAFAANAVSFAISAILIAAVRGQFRGKPPAASDSGPPSSSIWAGARFLWHNTALMALTVIGAVTFMATEIAAVADLPLIHDFGVGGVGYGIMNVAWGAGGLAGALIAARIVTKDSETIASAARRTRSAGACSLPWVLSLPSPARSASDSLDSWSRRQAGVRSTSAAGSIDVACAVALGVILRRRAGHPARPPLPAEAHSPGETQHGQAG